MSQNLKDILKNGEEQFDPKAWESLSQRLETVMPVKKTNPFSPKNLLITGASALFIGSGVFFFMNQSNGTVSKVKQNTETQNQITENNSTSEQKINVVENNTIESKINQKNKVFQTNNLVKEKLEKETDNESYNDYLEKNNLSVIEENSKERNGITETILTPFKAPKLQGTYCLNDEITIENSNKSKCFLLNESKVVVATIKGKENAKISLKNAGSYYLEFPVYDNNSSENQVDYVFSVKESKQAEFSFDSEILFENCIPYINLTASDFQNGMTWSANKGEIKEQSDKTKLTVFKKGIYTVSLEKIDENKCKTVKTQQIEIAEDYNLLAPTAFDPTDLDPRNNRFMPYALTKRNVMFDLIILDPSSGKIVFQSNTSDNTWDGIDKNTGQMVKSNKSFIWKVSLKNPEIGEKPEYTGTIVIIKN